MRSKYAKKKNRTYARYRWREKHKKQYTFTKTKFVAGFFLSLLTSVFLGSYFDKYGSMVLHQSVEAIATAMNDSSPANESTKESMNASDRQAETDMETLAERAKAVTMPRRVEIRSSLSPKRRSAADSLEINP